MISEEEFKELRKKILPIKNKGPQKNNHWFLESIIIEWL
jgi:hypothetical protein